jgi:hypothetical protein
MEEKQHVLYLRKDPPPKALCGFRSDPFGQVMNIVFLTHNGKEGSKLSRQFCGRGAIYHRAMKTMMEFCVGRLVASWEKACSKNVIKK